VLDFFLSMDSLGCVPAQEVALSVKFGAEGWGNKVHKIVIVLFFYSLKE
jgi:hypothetical protein